MNTRKIFFYVGLICLTVLCCFSCSDDMTGPSGNSKIVTGLYGYLHDYDSQHNIANAQVLDFEGLVSVGIDTIGLDTLINLKLLTPPDSVLKPIELVAEGSFGGSVNISNPDARASYTLNVYFYDSSSGNASGNLYRSNLHPSLLAPDDYYVLFLYCDRDVNLTGRTVLLFSLIGPSDTMVYNVNINLSRGWNPVTYKAIRLGNHYYEYTVTDDNPTDAKWYYWDNQFGIDMINAQYRH